MDDYQYFYNKSKRRINGFLILCVIGVLIGIYFAVKYDNLGRYENENQTLIVATVGFGGILLYMLIYRGLLALCGKSQTATTIAIVLTMPLGLFFYWPMIKFHRGDIPVNHESDKVLKATVRAYQKAWARQCFLQRVILPIVMVAILYGVYQLFLYLQVSQPKVLEWVGIIVFVILFFLTLYLIGGAREVTRTYDYYEGSVGTGIFDSGELKWTKTKSVTKDETDVSFIGIIISIVLFPFEVVLLIALVLLFVFVQVVRIFIPTGGRRTIYFHKSKMCINPIYMPGGESFFGFLIIFINRVLGAVFRVNFVNNDFWEDGVGTNYIYQNLSNRNLKYLEKLLDKVEYKYGYYYDF